MQRHRAAALYLVALLVLAPCGSLAATPGSNALPLAQQQPAGSEAARAQSGLVPFGQHAAGQRQLQQAGARRRGGCSEFSKEFISQYARENTVLVSVVDILVMK
jgi:hypothetical protein